MIEAFGPYELIARIGMGGMAEVFLARRREAAGFVKDVVIKRILPAYSQDHDFVQMFHDEARLAATLRHANIVQVTGFGEVRGQWFIELELVEGADLARLLRYARVAKRPIGANRAVQITMAAARGLSYAHERSDGGQKLQIVHRDISPANIMVSVHGDVKVMDFGIAKALARATQTVSGVVKGKQSYMAPEHAIGQAEQRSDIFELGICLWEMIADRRLYVADAQHLYIELARRADIPPIQQVAETCPPDLALVVTRALARELDDRYQTMRELERDLNQVLFKMGGAIAAPLEEWVQAVLPPADLKLLQGEVVEPPSLPSADGRTALPSVSVAPAQTAATAALRVHGVQPEAATASVSTPLADVLVTRSETLSDAISETKKYVREQAPAQPRRWIAVAVVALVVTSVGVLGALLRSREPPPAVMAPSIGAIKTPAEAMALPEPASEPSVVAPPVPEPVARPVAVKPKASLAARPLAVPPVTAKVGYVQWQHCATGTKISENKKVLGFVTDVNRLHFAVSVGEHVFDVEMPTGHRFRRSAKVQAPPSEDFYLECN